MIIYAHNIIIIINTQIRASDIDFWNSKYDIMRLKHDVKMYPPRVKMTLPSYPGFSKLPVKFEGCQSIGQSLDFDVSIPLVAYANQTSLPPRRRSRERMCCKLLYNIN